MVSPRASELSLGAAGEWQLVFADPRMRVFRGVHGGLAVQLPAIPAEAQSAPASPAPMPLMLVEAPAGFTDEDDPRTPKRSRADQ